MFRSLRVHSAVLSILFLASCVPLPICCVPLPFVSCTPAPEQLTMWLAFDDDALGGTTNDLASMYEGDVQLTATGSVAGLSVPGMRDKAYAFDQKTRSDNLRRVSHVTLLGSPAANLGLTQDFTIDFWVYPFGCSVEDRGARRKTGAKYIWPRCQQTIMGNGGYYVPGWRIDISWLYGYSDGGMSLIFGQSPNHKIAAQTPIPLNTWTHVAITVTRSGTIKTYINASLVKTEIVPTGTINISTNIGAQPFVVGAGYYAPNSPHTPSFRGYLDEVEISEEILDGNDISAITAFGKCK
jgi:hypothetical protein